MYKVYTYCTDSANMYIMVLSAIWQNTHLWYIVLEKIKNILHCTLITAQ